MTNTTEWLLPSEALKESCGFAFDIGGTSCKVVYIKEGASNNVNKELNDYRVYCATFLHCDLDQAISLVESRTRDIGSQSNNDGEKDVVHTTGVSVKRTIKDSLQEAFHGRIENIVEVKSMLKGITFLLDTFPLFDIVLHPSERALMWSRKVEPTLRQLSCAMSNNHSDTRVDHIQCYLDSISAHQETHASGTHAYPYMLCNMGSSGSYFVVHEDCRCIPIGGTTQAGKYLLGMSSLLLDVKDYDELMNLAEKGEAGNLSVTMKDLKDPDNPDLYDAIPDAQEVFSFGKATTMDKSQFKREDIARAWLAGHSLTTAKMLFMTACVNNCQNIYLVGGLFNHALYRDLFFAAFVETLYFNFKLDTKHLYFIKNGSYVAALGTMLLNADYHQERRLKSKTCNI